MSVLVVVLALGLLIAVFGLINYLAASRLEAPQENWFKQVLPPGVSKEAFLRQAPYTYLPLKGSKAYGIVDKRTQQEVWKCKTPEEAEAWIVTNTLAETGQLPQS